MNKVVDYLTACHDYSVRGACALTRQRSPILRETSRRGLRLELTQQMCEIAQTLIRYGYRRIQIMLWHAEWPIRRNLVYRLNSEEGLALRNQRPRGCKTVVHRED